MDEEPLVLILEGVFLVEGREQPMDMQISLRITGRQIVGVDEAIDVTQYIENGVPSFDVAFNLSKCTIKECSK